MGNIEFPEGIDNPNFFEKRWLFRYQQSVLNKGFTLKEEKSFIKVWGM